MGLGQRFTHSIASSLDFTFQSQKPAISSFDSVKGPSITVRFVPENLTRAPFELGWRPSPASMMPAFPNSSLNFPISVRSFWLGILPASESLLAFMITMNRMLFLLIRNLAYTQTANVHARNRQLQYFYFYRKYLLSGRR